MISAELREIAFKHSGRQTLVVGSCMGEESPEHDDSSEWLNGEPHPALDPGLFPGLQGLNIVLLSDLLAAHPQLTIYFLFPHVQLPELQDEAFEPLGHLKHLCPSIPPAVSLLTAEATVAVSSKELGRAIAGAGKAQKKVRSQMAHPLALTPS